MKRIRLSLLLVLGLITPAYAQIIDVNFSGGGTTSYSEWSNLGVSYEGYGGGFPGPASWPAPIPATTGLTNASLNRTSGGSPGTGPYITGSTNIATNGAFISVGSVYFGSFSGSNNVFGGTVRLTQPSPLSGLQTIVFQIQIGEALGYDFFQPSGSPALTLDGGSLAVPVSFTNLVNRFENGVDPISTTNPVFINTWAYQWNLTNGQTPTSYTISLSGVAHSQIYALRLDSTTALQQQAVVPEPSAVSLLIIASIILGLYAVKKQRRKIL